MLLLQIRCRWCGLNFCVCRRCFRGQAYCCDECRLAARRKIHREAQRRYRKTEKGKKAHRQAENRRRNDQKPNNQKNMDDTTSIQEPICDTEGSICIKSPEICIAKEATCRFCGAGGQIVQQFPRRGYG